MFSGDDRSHHKEHKRQWWRHNHETQCRRIESVYLSKFQVLYYCKMPHYKNSQTLAHTRLGVNIFLSLWNLAGALAAALPGRMPNLREIEKPLTPTSFLRAFTRSYDETSYAILNRPPGIYGHETLIFVMRIHVLVVDVVFTMQRNLHITRSSIKKHIAYYAALTHFDYPCSHIDYQGGHDNYWPPMTTPNLVKMTTFSFQCMWYIR